jgi:hypothetical protein
MTTWRWAGMPKERKVVKVKVVRIKGKDAIVEELKGLLREFKCKTSYDEVEGEEEGILYRYEELHVTGYVDNVYIAVTCDNENCKVEAPIYSFLITACHCKPKPDEVRNCVTKVVNETREVMERVKVLQAMVQELAQYGFEVNNVYDGAEAYWSKVDESTRSHIRVHLSPRTSILQLQVEGEPTRLVGIARLLAKLVG